MKSVANWIKRFEARTALLDSKAGFWFLSFKLEPEKGVVSELLIDSQEERNFGRVVANLWMGPWFDNIVNQASNWICSFESSSPSAYRCFIWMASLYRWVINRANDESWCLSQWFRDGRNGWLAGQSVKESNGKHGPSRQQKEQLEKLISVWREEDVEFVPRRPLETRSAYFRPAEDDKVFLATNEWILSAESSNPHWTNDYDYGSGGERGRRWTGIKWTVIIRSPVDRMMTSCSSSSSTPLLWWL